jgi:hypothetical protein
MLAAFGLAVWGSAVVGENWQVMRHCTTQAGALLATTNCCGNFVCEPNHANLETAHNCPEDCLVPATASSAPTPAPPATLPSEPDIGPPPTAGACRNYNEWIPDGQTRVGQGPNYCSLCHCAGGTLDCGGHSCGEPFGGAYPTTARRCSHLACSVGDTRPGASPQHTLRTMHHHSERHGELHSCAWNRFLRECACVCWPANPGPATCADAGLNEKCEWPDRQAGVTALGQGIVRASGALCEEISFDTPFNPAKGPTRVAITVATTDVGRGMPWVAGTKSSSFTICRVPQAHEQRSLHWLAWQGDKVRWNGHSPFAGALAMVSKVAVGGWAANERTCRRIQFPRAFRVLAPSGSTPPPLVFGGIVAGADEKLAEGFTYNTEQVGTTHFSLCFTAAAAGSGDLDFAWLAFERQGMGGFWAVDDPWKEAFTAKGSGSFGHFSAAGNAVALDASTSVSSFDAAGLPVVTQKICRTVAYGSRVDCPQCDGFDATPVVVVSAKRIGSSDTGTLATYITAVGKMAFTVCSTERSAAATPGTDLTWDWMAFAAKAKDTYVAKPGYHMQASKLQPCGLGHYCMHGVRKAIAVGFYGAFGTNTTYSAIKRCGGQKYFCWGGVRHTVAAGYKSVGGDSSFTRTAQLRCTDPKYYCSAGVEMLVPSAWYSMNEQKSAAPCGAVQYYCKDGVRHSAQPGYYTAGGIDGTLRTSQRSCGGVAWYCQDGERKAIPAGFIGQGGSTVDTHSSYAKCGSERVYCLGGIRHTVSPGFHGTGGDSTTRTAQQPCTIGMQGCGPVPVDRYAHATGSAIDKFMALFKQKKEEAAAALSQQQPPPPSETVSRLHSIWGRQPKVAGNWGT